MKLVELIPPFCFLMAMVLLAPHIDWPTARNGAVVLALAGVAFWIVTGLMR